MINAPRVCRVCGCVDEDACLIGVQLSTGVAKRACGWAEPDLCDAHNLTANETLISGPSRDHREERPPTDAALYNKYVVTHKDGQPIGEGERYFVLAPDKDDPSKIGLRAYTWAVSHTNPALAASLADAYGIDGFVFVRGRAVQARLEGAILNAVDDPLDRRDEYTALRMSELRENDRLLSDAISAHTQYRMLRDAVRSYLAIDLEKTVGDDSMAFYSERYDRLRMLVADDE